MKKIIAIVALQLALAGCAQQTFTLRDGAARIPHETRQTFIVHGIGQSQTIDAAAVCGGADKVARTEVQQSGMDVFLRVVTLGIYTPREARVYCSL
jgi:hypothetical protein